MDSFIEGMVLGSSLTASAISMLFLLLEFLGVAVC